MAQRKAQVIPIKPYIRSANTPYESRLKLQRDPTEVEVERQRQARAALGLPDHVDNIYGQTDDPSGYNQTDAAYTSASWGARKYVPGYARGGRTPFGADGAPTPITGGPRVIDLDTGDTKPLDPSETSTKIELGDGSVLIDLNPFEAFNIEGVEDEDEPEKTFQDNLALTMDPGELAFISAQVIDGIQQDEQSRREVLETRQKGIKLLGLRIEEPRGDTGTSSAPLEGMSTVRHSLLLEACTTFQAGARAELLPAAGPAKIRNDTPIGAPSAPPGQPPLGLGSQPLDELASALETGFNRYLTKTLTHYVPETDRMLFTVAFSGDGFKKLYHDPLKQRPTSVVVDPEDLIVSNMATDIDNCGRVTHRIRMRKSVLRRMQIIGSYRDVPLQQAAVADVPNAVKQEIADVMGAQAEPMRPQDVEYTVYESYVELDLPEHAPKQFKNKGLPLPYRVTIEKDSRQILEITRDWKEDDPLCERRKTFVQYPFIPALGFYSLGFLHLLGNTTLALTAATREMLDAGMFANFPGFIYAKQVGRQLTNQFRCPPGGGISIELPSGMAINQVVMPLPYKEVGPAFPAFIQHVEQNGRQLAMVANAPVAEGKQDAPVGTTLALIEQQTKVLGSAFKRLHMAQAREFEILVELLREDPEAFWRKGPTAFGNRGRGNSEQPAPWTKKQLLAALDKYELEPVADPNNPTSLHRMAKAAMLKTLQAANPNIYDPIAIDRRILTMANIDPEGIFAAPKPQQADPIAMMLQARLQIEQTKLAIKDKEIQIKALTAAMQQQGDAADRASQERIEVLKQQMVQDQMHHNTAVARLKVNSDMIQHVHGLLSKFHSDNLDRQQNAISGPAGPSESPGSSGPNDLSGQS